MVKMRNRGWAGHHTNKEGVPFTEKLGEMDDWILYLTKPLVRSATKKAELFANVKLVARTVMPSKANYWMGYNLSTCEFMAVNKDYTILSANRVELADWVEEILLTRFAVEIERESINESHDDDIM